MHVDTRDPLQGRLTGSTISYYEENLLLHSVTAWSVACLSLVVKQESVKDVSNWGTSIHPRHLNFILEPLQVRLILVEHFCQPIKPTSSNAAHLHCSICLLFVQEMDLYSVSVVSRPRAYESCKRAPRL